MLSSKFVFPADMNPDVLDHRVIEPQMCGFILIRERWVRRELQDLRLDQATGPNDIPARLVECASVLSRSLCRNLRGMIARLVRPQLWCFLESHHFSKRRGVHSIELIGFTSRANRIKSCRARIFVSYFGVLNANWDTQFAFRQKIGCHVILLILMCA